ncbi:peptidylprolyl isomerase [Spirosoma sp.]|uniref:peptidylprolyl isomerase n=1 Tax=Spirosoma sp. TaxID=1899569 RepID=UPI003B3AFF1E
MMKRYLLTTLNLFLFFSIAGAQRIRLDTEAGTIELELYASKAPITVANFLRYVDDKRYDGATFYRVVRPDNQANNPIKIDVIQGGLRNDSLRELPPISQETTQRSGLKHLDGTLSMARGKPGSGSSEFFICINDQPELDFGGKRNPDGQGFAAFGRVVKGMNVVRKIQKGQTAPSANAATSQMLKNPVMIRTARRIR